jgi:hypothetical protein
MTADTYITIWERNKNRPVDHPLHGQFEFNHISLGLCQEDTPPTVSQLQKGDWSHCQWKKTFGFLSNSKVITLESIG